MTEGAERSAGIRDLLRRDALCLRIARYFARHNDAADTARGIAEWWIDRDVAATDAALVRLLEHGVVTSHVVQNGTSVYRYTKNTRVRKTVTDCLNTLVAPGSRG